MAGRLGFHLRWRLSVLWALEWGISGTLLTYLPIYWKQTIQLSTSQTASLFAVAAVGLWVAPFLVGQVADRWLASEKYLAVSHFIGGLTLVGFPHAAETYKQTGDNFVTLLVMSGIYSVAYIPTWALASSLTFRHLTDPDAQFGKVRVWGTVGWMSTGLFLSLWLMQDEFGSWLSRFPRIDAPRSAIAAACEWLPSPQPSDCFSIAALLSFALSSFCIFLPHTPPERTQRDGIAPLEMLKMFRSRDFRLFMGISFLMALLIPMYNLVVPVFLTTGDIEDGWVPAVMLIGQISEFPALLLLGLFLKRLGMKITFSVGIGAWFLRYGLFSISGGAYSLILVGLALHGICHVFMIIVAQLYIDSQCRHDLRASAQNFLAFVTLGIGMPLGLLLAGKLDDGFDGNYPLLFAIAAASCLILLVVFWKRFEGPKTIAVAPPPNSDTETQNPEPESPEKDASP
ncbi:putative nucleoside transporter YegT [Symmachiella macrocystis]|uniref:Putative nucleoside transporter YegT n=1 Tax=Symmachiella macrocystis TaxID=2527985 RepID=A0A5C6BI40_9PLAN|nr:MFS transporter [Symmachiella macrocystis]TWU11382.1 putative nucleoside transporter YegT [Symmachiella macrocystis]